jgi:hypothetical protein
MNANDSVGSKNTISSYFSFTTGLFIDYCPFASGYNFRVCIISIGFSAGSTKYTFMPISNSPHPV